MLSAAAQELADFELESTTEVERHELRVPAFSSSLRRGASTAFQRDSTSPASLLTAPTSGYPAIAARPTDQAERTVDLILEWAQWDRVSNPRPQSGGEGGCSSAGCVAQPSDVTGHPAPSPVSLTVVAMMLAFVAGFVDAVGYLHVVNVFPANQSGNVAFLGLSIGGASPAPGGVHRSPLRHSWSASRSPGGLR